MLSRSERAHGGFHEAFLLFVCNTRYVTNDRMSIRDRPVPDHAAIPQNSGRRATAERRWDYEPMIFGSKTNDIGLSLVHNKHEQT